ncbi:hypothetical protein FL857_02390 [Criibacterium bergeronii]|uniref:Uncharacterized protein n=1 Tax=Criibacterium bergeronii TaxID=1871336 RepID=A0A552VCY3_9FIRM|nr:hypothetical protein [Criibacterium bergeronii]TRW28331.1 hypothetical protein FL857_02390 [Criibacterium bergeronii]
MNIQSINCNSPIASQTKSANKPIPVSVKSFSEETVSWMYHAEKNTLFTASMNIGDGNMYSYRGSYAEDSTEQNPKIKIEYHYNDDKETKIKYIHPKEVDPKNATVDEYNCLLAYTMGKTTGVDMPHTTGIHYNEKDKYDFAALLQRDIQMYKINSVPHHVLKFQKILNHIQEHMSTDHFKNNVDTNRHGIGVEQALAISRKYYGFEDNSKKVNVDFSLDTKEIDKHLKSNKQRQIEQRKEQAKKAQAKRQQDKEELEELLERLRLERKLTQEKIFEVQDERKANLSRLQRENRLKNNPYAL